MEDGPGPNGIVARSESGGSGDSKKSSSVDLTIEDMLQTPHSSEREHERDLESDHLYAPHPLPNAYLYPGWNRESYARCLTPLPFMNFNSSSGSSPHASGSSTSTSIISLGAGLSPAEQAAASATGRKSDKPKLSWTASNYGPQTIDGEGEEEESRPSSTSARSIQKRGYADEESEDGAKKRLRVDDKSNRVNMSAIA